MRGFLRNCKEITAMIPGMEKQGFLERIIQQRGTEETQRFAKVFLLGLFFCLLAFSFYFISFHGKTMLFPQQFLTQAQR